MKIIFHYVVKKRVEGSLYIHIEASLKHSEIPKSHDILGFGVKVQGCWQILVDREFLGTQGFIDFDLNVHHLIKECLHPDVKPLVYIL
jgi:hypothetical protein